MSRGRNRPQWFADDYQRIVVDQGRCVLGKRPYIPLFRILDFSSYGWRTAVKSWITDAVGELMSDPELHYYMQLHGEPDVRDIAYQHAHDPVETREIVQELRKDPKHAKLAHPSVNGRDTIMSTDFVITKADGSMKAVAVKREEDLDWRVEEKLLIEEQFWRRRDVEWELVCDTDIKAVQVANVALLYDRHDAAKLPVDAAAVQLLLAYLTPHMVEGILPFGHACRRADAQLSFPPGTALAVSYHAIIRRIWPVDFSQPIDRRLPLNFLPQSAAD